MTLDIIKPTQILETDNTVVQAGIDALIAGIVDGSVTDIHTAVERVNSTLGKNLSGNVVRPYFKALYQELKAFDAEADRLARDGMSISQIVSELTAYIAAYDVHFVIADLQQMKIEVYGSVADWLSEMRGE